MNDRDPKWHDLYRVDLATGKRTLVQKNDGEFGGYLADDGYTVRYATRARPTAARTSCSRTARVAGRSIDDIPFEDSLTTQPAGSPPTARRCT